MEDRQDRGRVENKRRHQILPFRRSGRGPPERQDLVTAFVFDSSAVLAIFHREPGADVVRAALPAACISSVNYAEVITKLIEEGLPFGEAEALFKRLYCPVVEADEDRAAMAGAMHEETRRSGVSLGDRFCLQLARELHVPVLTIDRRWKTLDLGVEVTLIR